MQLTKILIVEIFIIPNKLKKEIVDIRENPNPKIEKDGNVIEKEAALNQIRRLENGSRRSGEGFRGALLLNLRC